MRFLLRVALALLLPLACFGSITSQVANSGPFTIASSPQTIPVGFPFQQGSDLVVTDTGTTGTPRVPAAILTLGSDYTVTGGGYNSAVQMQVGSIVVVGTGANAVLTNDILFISRGVPVNQTTSFSSTGPLTIQLIEQALDKTATISQEVLADLYNPITGPATPLTVASNGLLNSNYTGGSGFITRAGQVFDFSASQVILPVITPTNAATLTVANVAALRTSSVANTANGQ